MKHRAKKKKFLPSLIFSLFSVLFITKAAYSTDLPDEIKMKFGMNTTSGYYELARILQEYFPRHLPGNPKINIEVEEAGVGLVLQKKIVTSEPKDGSVFGFVSITIKYIGMEEKLGFDPSQIKIIGKLTSDTAICVAPKDKALNIKNEDIKVAAITKSSGTYHAARILQIVKDAKFQIVTGYKGSQEIFAAMERGEVDAYCGTGSDRFIRENREKTFDIIYTFGREFLPDHIQAEDLKETAPKQYRDIVDFYTLNYSEMSNIILPGDTDEQIVNTYRSTFNKLVNDPDFLAAVKQNNLRFYPRNGVETQKIMENAYSMNPELRAKLEKLKQ